jgi:hypothetical protein
MLSKLTSNQKALLGISGFILLIGIPICIASILFLNSQRTSQPTPTPILNITYCGANPQEICVYSFGRDGTGDTIINLFLPKDFPDFYLKINKTSGEARYECEKNDDVQTSAYCIGEAILLGEQIEITIFSLDEDIPIAFGKFAVTAILISSQTQDSSSPPIRTSTPVSATETFTLTPASSYPNESYPNETDSTSTPTSESESTRSTPSTSYP